MQLALPRDYDPAYIRPGAVLCDPKYPIHMVKKFKARIIVYDVDYPVTKGRGVVVHAFSHRMPAILEKLDATINQKTEEVKKVKPRHLVAGDFA